MKNVQLKKVFLTSLPLLGLLISGCIGKNLNTAPPAAAYTLSSNREVINRLRGVIPQIGQDTGSFKTAIQAAKGNTPTTRNPAKVTNTALQAIGFIVNGMCTEFTNETQLTGNYKINNNQSVTKNQAALLAMALDLFSRSTSIQPGDPNGIYTQATAIFNNQITSLVGASASIQQATNSLCFSALFSGLFMTGA